MDSSNQLDEYDTLPEGHDWKKINNGEHRCRKCSMVIYRCGHPDNKHYDVFYYAWVESRRLDKYKGHYYLNPKDFMKIPLCDDFLMEKALG